MIPSLLSKWITFAFLWMPYNGEITELFRDIQFRDESKFRDIQFVRDTSLICWFSYETLKNSLWLLKNSSHGRWHILEVGLRDLAWWLNLRWRGAEIFRKCAERVALIETLKMAALSAISLAALRVFLRCCHSRKIGGGKMAPTRKGFGILIPLS